MDNFDEEYVAEEKAEALAEEAFLNEKAEPSKSEPEPSLVSPNGQNCFFKTDEKDVSNDGKREMFPEEFFWKEAMQSTVASRKYAVKMLVGLTLAFIAGAALMTTAFYGTGWLTNRFGKSKNIEFTLPIVDRPDLDDEYYQSDGRYTTEGVAKVLEESIVYITAYTLNNSYFAQGQGSGIIMSEDGYIVTNAHVIADSMEDGVKVRLFDQSEYQATIVGSDPRTDIAVIKINAKGLKPVQFGNSDQLQLGEEIMAIGNPAGLEGSISKGIVSGLDREIRVDDNHEKMNCIQVDAAINPGNSGGALVNMWGQVVGIISSKLASENYDGIGFAISINAAKPIIEDLMEYGCIPGRVRIGISFYEVTEELAEEFGTPAGLLIQSVDATCDIARSGLRSGDVITHMDGYKVSTLEEVDEAIKDKKAGDTVSATVVRDGETFEISFKLMDDSASLKVNE